MKKVSFLLFFASGVFMLYFQNDYVLVLERIDFVKYDEKYFYLAQAKTFKFNRSHTAINFTFNTKGSFGNDLKIQLQAYKFASNEYRLFPIRFMFDMCSTLEKNDWGIQNIYSCGNLSKCPVAKGNFTICNWAPDYSRFPPYIPGGRYKSDMTFIYKAKEVALLEVYVEVKPKNKWELNQP